jgi:hypothetical protein
VVVRMGDQPNRKIASFGDRVVFRTGDAPFGVGVVFLFVVLNFQKAKPTTH